MTAIRRHLPPSAGRRLLRDAGPPTAWALIAMLAGAPVIGLAAVSSDGVPLILVLAWLIVLTVPSILDRDGWRIRIGMAWLATEQRRRLQSPMGMPRTPAGAGRWLARSEAADAGLTRASVLLIAGRTDEARRLVESHPIADQEDRARVARLAAAIDGLERGQVDPSLAVVAIDALPPAARRYHRLSLAWSTAWVDSSHGRPWRRAFAAASRDIGTAGVPGRYLAYGAVQELLLPIIGVMLVLLANVLGWL